MCGRCGQQSRSRRQVAVMHARCKTILQTSDVPYRTLIHTTQCTASFIQLVVRLPVHTSNVMNCH